LGCVSLPLLSGDDEMSEARVLCAASACDLLLKT